MIIKVDATTLWAAAEIHAQSWRASHKDFCRADFIAAHTTERQKAYLQRELEAGKQLYMLIADKPTGIVSVNGPLIENLYVLPCEQRKGYGTALLRFALKQCAGTPCLWILSNNWAAYALYTKHGFRPTGNKRRLSDALSEIEMQYAAALQ